MVIHLQLLPIFTPECDTCFTMRAFWASLKLLKYRQGNVNSTGQIHDPSTMTGSSGFFPMLPNLQSMSHLKIVLHHSKTGDGAFMKALKRKENTMKPCVKHADSNAINPNHGFQCFPRGNRFCLLK